MQYRRYSLVNDLNQQWWGHVIFFIVVFLIGLCAPMITRADSSIHWKDRFTTAEQQKLRAWSSEVITHVEKLVGPLPFKFHINIYRQDGASEPVPWANTRRGHKLGVDFYVDPAYPLDAFRNDWTAAHEFSHLILPYLGARHAWFAEGFASFMQYQVMESMSVLSKHEKGHRYTRSLDTARRNFAYPARPFVKTITRLRRDGKYSVMYWGSAVYFLQINDYLLRSQGSGLIDVLKDYVDCCRRSYGGLYELIDELDSVANYKIFSRHLNKFKSANGFPEYRHLDLAV